MSDMIAYCGINCSKCPSFLATQKNDIEEKKRIVQKWNESQWAKRRNMQFTQEDITCDGCLSKRISGYCRKVCVIRPCAQERKVKTCAHCADFKCEKLKNFLVDEPECEKNLAEIRKTI